MRRVANCFTRRNGWSELTDKPGSFRTVVNCFGGSESGLYTDVPPIAERMDGRILLVACCLAAIVAVPGVAFAMPDVGSDSTHLQTDTHGQESLLQEDQPEPDNTITRIEVESDGSATWTLRFRTRLATDEDVEDYRRFQDSFRDDTGHYLDPFRDRMTGVVANAEATTDRRMQATGFEASTSIQEVPRRWGVVVYRFEWEGFAATDEGRVVVGDVFAGGFFIDEGDVLEIASPDGYTITDADPTPDETTDDVVEWSGREDFADNHPRVVAEGTPAASPQGGTQRTELLSLVAIAAVFVLIAGGVYARRQRTDDDADAGETPGEASTATGITEADDSEAQNDASELVTDETQVRELLAERGGRMKQSEIVDALGWSKSKTSRVLSGMAEDGNIEKLRIGRENIIDLADESEE